MLADGYKRTVEAALRLGSGGDVSALLDAFEMVTELERLGMTVVLDKNNIADTNVYDQANFALAHALNKQVRKSVGRALQEQGSSQAAELFKRSLLFDAPYGFDEFCRYIEWERPQDKQFYVPRRKQLLPVAYALQDLEDDRLDLLAISMPPGAGKTTLALFYLAWIGGRHPQLGSLMGSHSRPVLEGAYEEVLRIVRGDDEYLFTDVFPKSRVVDTKAKDLRIDLQTTKRFQTFQFASVGTSKAGSFRAFSLLYCDDLVDGIETAMSKERLDKLWAEYNTDFRQRKIGNCKELHIATRWSVWDIIGRLEERYGGSDRSRFIRMPAMDENDESNFDYPYGVGFSTNFYREQRSIMDQASWLALYMNEPVERYGLLYDPLELRRYFELPEREPDAILAVSDTKNKGSDYGVMPVAYKYGDDYYIDAFVCDNGKPEIVDAKMVKLLLERNVEQAQFESNNAGGRIAENIQREIREKGGRTRITTRWVQSNKETRIMVASPWVKDHCLFKDASLYTHDPDYRTAMKLLTSYTLSGKNKHDDVPDAMAALYNLGTTMESKIVSVFKRPW